MSVKSTKFVDDPFPQERRYGPRPKSEPTATGHTANYLSCRGLSWAVTACLFLAILSSIAVVAVYLRAIGLGDVLFGAKSKTRDEVEILVGMFVVSNAACLLATLATTVTFLIWFQRAYRNLDSLHAKHLKFSPGWAVGCWFVPGLNLVRPYQIAREIWVSSTPKTLNRNLAASRDFGDMPVKRWWTVFVAMVFLAIYIFARMPGLPAKNPKDALLYHSMVDSGYHCLRLVAAVLAIYFVLKVTHWQGKRYKKICDEAAA